MATKPDPQAPDATEEDLAGAAFAAFAQSVPGDTRIYVTLKRMPSYLHPQVTQPEDLPAPAFAADLEEVQKEIRARYGPGRYRLYVRYVDPKTQKSRFTWPTFTLAPTPEEEEAAAATRAGPPPDALDEAMARLGRAAALRAQAAELEAAEAAATWGRKPTGAPPDPQGELVRALLPALISSLKPQDPIALARNLRELLAPAKGDGGIAGMAEGMAALMDVAERLGGRPGGGGFWAVAIPHIAQVLEKWGPYLPAFARALARGAEEARTARGAPAKPEPPPAAGAEPPGPGAEPAAEPVAQAAGEDPRKQFALQTLLNMAYLEMTSPGGAQPGEAREDGYATLGDFCLAHLPGIREDLLKMDGEQVWATWSALDPRVPKLGDAGRAWVEGFRAFLVLGPTEPGGTP